MIRLKASLLYFAIVLGSGFVLGMFRVPVLVPRLGERYAELLEIPVMLAVIMIAARYVVARFKLPANGTARLQVGFSALALSIAAELLLAAGLQSQSIAQYIAGRDPVSGSVYLLLLLVFALMPTLLARVRPSGRG